MPRHELDSAIAPLPVAELSERERIACLRLVRSETVGPATFRTLINRAGGAEEALAMLPELARRGGRRAAPRVPSRQTVEVELDHAQKIGARPVFTIEPGYPAALAALEHPPPMIYTLGRNSLFERPGIAIVGSREASAAGLTFTRQLSADLGRAGFVVVSGMARGIDSAAHATALSCGTIAVLAGGVDNIYPPENRNLHAAIAEQGCLVSEQPPGFKPRGKDFPRRNRLISGLSLGVVIVEAATRSGSLITARTAGEQGRLVLAVPGHPLDPRARGTNALLRDGATLVADAAHVVEALRPLTSESQIDLSQLRAPDALVRTAPEQLQLQAGQTGIALSDTARAGVIAVLGPTPTHVDDIARAAGLSSRDTQIVILELSLAGRLEHHGGQLISLRPGTG
ncbi:MAG: DNA-processing protein DprA [Pseudomonadota bacterium]